jgi:membrane protein required for beta-lactamase induction
MMMNEDVKSKNRRLFFGYVTLILLYVLPYILGLFQGTWRGVPLLLLWMMTLSFSFVVLTVIGYFHVFVDWSKDVDALIDKEEISK